jgi:hypothetical protein
LIHKSINIIQHINRIKDKKPHHNINNTKKSLRHSSASFHDKSSEETRNRRHIPQHYKSYIYDKAIVHIILNGEKLKPLPLKSGMRQRCPLSPLLFNIVLEFLARAIRQEKDTRDSSREGRSQIVPICR